MQRIREYWLAFRNIAIMFSFIMNFVLLLILLFVVNLIFQIKNGIAEPLVDGLHTNFVGLNEADIQTNVVVDDEIPIDFDLTLDETTTVTLAQPATINNVPAQFDITGGGGSISGTVDITLPQGTPLTIDLSLLVPVEQQIPIVLNVPVDIALSETELAIPFNNLRLLFEPYVKILDNLPSRWSDVPDFAMDAIQGDVNLVAATNGSRNPLSADYFLPQTETTSDEAVDSDSTDTENVSDSTNGDSDTPVPDDVPTEATEPAGPTNTPTATFTPGPSPTPSITPFVPNSAPTSASP